MAMVPVIHQVRTNNGNLEKVRFKVKLLVMSSKPWYKGCDHAKNQHYPRAGPDSSLPTKPVRDEARAEGAKGESFKNNLMLSF